MAMFEKKKDPETGEASVPALAGLTTDQLTECFTLGATLEQVKELADAGFGYAQIKHLAGTLGQAKSQGAGLSAADLRQVLQDQRKALRPENDRHPGISAFSYPEGDVKRPKPALRRKTYFNGIQEQEDALSPTEIELYNRIDHPGRTARNGMWKAAIKRNGSAEELFIITEPHTLDGRQSLPGITSILRELLDGAAAANPDMLAERVAELEARIKQLSAAPAA